MMEPVPQSRRILAIEPSTRGFGYVVLEEPKRLVDWGLKEVKGEKNVRCLCQVRHLLKLYKPDIVAVENITRNSRRCKRVRELIQYIHQQGQRSHVTTKAVGEFDFHKSYGLSECSTSYDIAKMLAKQFDEVADRLPPPRKPWDGLHQNMAIFGAIQLALALKA